MSDSDRVAAQERRPLLDRMRETTPHIQSYVVRAEHDPLRHHVRLYDASGDWRSFPCRAVCDV